MRKAKKNITVADISVTYYRLGSGPLLLFLHGGRTRALTYKKLLIHLSKTYTVIAPDIPGFGASDTPPTVWSFTDYAAFFDTFLAHLRLNNVTIVGYSMGGGIAANLAAASDRIVRLTLIDASGIRKKSRKRGYQDMRRLKFYATHPRFAVALFMLLSDYIQYVWKHLADWPHMQQIRYACFTTDYDDNLHRITIPTRLLWGRDDWVYPLSVAHTFQQLIPQAKLEIVPGNHDWLVYDPLLIKDHVI